LRSHEFEDDKQTLLEPIRRDANGNSEQRCICKVCWEVFENKDSLMAHVANHASTAKADRKPSHSDIKWDVMWRLFALRRNLDTIRKQMNVPFQVVSGAAEGMLDEDEMNIDPIGPASLGESNICHCKRCRF
jgi:hypothetical protein